MLKGEKDKNLKRILRCIGMNPSVSPYKIDRIIGLRRNVVTRKIKQFDLIKEGILDENTIYTGKRMARCYTITLQGMIYALNIKAFTPEEAATIRIRASIEVPYTPDPILRRVFEPGSLFYKQLLELTTRIGLSVIEQNDGLMKLEKILRPFVEKKFSERIYAELLKKVNPNPSYYDENYAKYVFQSEYHKCFTDLFMRIFEEGDKDALIEVCKYARNPSEEELAEILKDYSMYMDALRRKP